MKLNVIHVPDVHDSFTARAPLRDRNDQKAETTNARARRFLREHPLTLRFPDTRDHKADQDRSCRLKANSYKFQ